MFKKTYFMLIEIYNDDMDLIHTTTRIESIYFYQSPKNLFVKNANRLISEYGRSIVFKQFNRL